MSKTPTKYPKSFSSSQSGFIRHQWSSHQKNANSDARDSFALGETVSTDVDFRKRNTPQKSNYDMRATSGSLFSSPRREPATERMDYPSSIRKSPISNKKIDVDDGNYLEKADVLLEKGRGVVQEREEQKKSIMSINAILQKQVMKAGKDIFPEQKRGRELREILKECQGKNAKYFDEIESLEKQIQRKRALIESRKREFQRKEEELIRAIVKIEREVEERKQEMVVCREEEAMETERLENKVIEVEEDEKNLVRAISVLKGRFNHTRKEQSLRQSRMEEKAYDFLGTLQCK